MTKLPEAKISRREFARQAAMLSGATLAPAAILELPGTAVAADQAAPNLPKLGPAGQAEADARLQNILSLANHQFDDEQTQLIRTLCIFLQPALDRVRAYPLENADSAALYLKPLVEREKKPQATRLAATPERP